MTIIHDDLKFKLPLIRDLITGLGFKICLTMKQNLIKMISIIKLIHMKNQNIFKNDDIHYKIFSSSAKKLNALFQDDDTLRAKLGYIDSILEEFNLKILLDRKQEHKGNKTSYYMLEQLNNVSKILEYKMNNGCKIYDRSKIYQKTKKYIYSHLVNQVRQFNIHTTEQAFNDCSVVDDVNDDLFIDDDVKDDEPIKRKTFVEFDDDITYDDGYVRQPHDNTPNDATTYVKQPIIITPIEVKPKMFVISFEDD
jgi:hypothetical protein